MDTELVAKALISLVAFAQGAGPLRVDLNATHATNPAWTPHARFHVVWQVLLQAGVSTTALLLLWVFPSRAHSWIAAFLALNWCVTFFITLSSTSLFAGTLKDGTNGIPPFVFRLGTKQLEVDTNLFGASVLAVLSLSAMALLLAS